MNNVLGLTAVVVAAACLFPACGGSSSGDGGGGSSSSSSHPISTSSSSGAGTSSAGTSSSSVAASTGSSSGASSSDTTSSSGATSSSTSSSGSATTYTPLCAGLTTAAGAAPTKAGICVAADPQLCYKTCGPKSSGFKSETCTTGAYAEQSGCSFPAGDYSCYKIPTTMSADCPATATPKSGDACTVADCTPCNVGGSYLDSTGAAKPGYCVCVAGAAGSKWSCASTTAWPCPGNTGC